MRLGKDTACDNRIAGEIGVLPDGWRDPGASRALTEPC